MRRARHGCALLMLFVACGAFAQSLSVAYIEGDAQARSGSSWTVLSVGDPISSEATLRLEEGAYVELSSQGAKITLSQKGTYKLHDIVSSSRALGSAGAGKALLTTLAHLAAGPALNQGAVAGARGANESKADDSEWVASSAQVFIDSGREYVKSGQYDQAIGQFLQALDSAANENESAEIRYNLAEAYSLKGDTRNALKQAAGLQPSSGDGWSADFVLLKAKLLMDTNAYAQEISWLTQQGNDLSGDAQRAQAYLFLLGVGYRGVGDTSKEKETLSKVVSISGESDLGKSAGQLLQSL
jgi:tetratricopeptide (TPR) repeat protein